jgi:nucleoside-diphosphate-sugar epimerase
MTISKVAVTGASGFIGAHIVYVLLERGYTVHACVRNKDDTKHQFLLDLEKSINGSNLQLFSAELLNAGAYDAAFAHVDAVIHAAAVLFISDSQDPQKDMVEPSTQGTLNVLSSIDKYSSIKHYVHTSSVAAVANMAKGATYDESDWSDVPIELDPYTYAKTEGEKVVWKATKGKPYTVSCINPTMVFGRSLSKPHTKASPYVFRQALLGNAYPNTAMSVVDVHDVAIAHVEAMIRPEADGKRFIIDGDEETLGVNAVIKEAERMFPQYQWSESMMPGPGKFLTKTWDNTSSKKILGMKMTSQEECIRATVQSMIETGWVKTRAKSRL